MRLPLSPWALPGDLRLLILSSLAALPLTHAISFQSVPSPNLDLSGLGRVMLAGNFDSISLYKYEGQDEDGLSPNGSQSLYSRYPTGAFAQLSPSDGYIEAMCSFVAADGQLNGIVVGGNFTGFGSTPAPSVALFDPNTGSIQALPGLNGQVSSVYCDTDASIVYVGGSFQGGNSTNAIAWVNGWTNLPFAGFNGPVSSIAKLPNGHIVFGGKFSEIGNLTMQTHMLPVSPQVINVGSANITSVGASSNKAYNNPSDIICTTPGKEAQDTNFLLADNAPGSITASFGYGFVPSHLRLLNTQVANHGTKTFSLTFFPQNGIANFTYYDDAGLHWCTDNCPLAQNGSYQDFYFVNSIGMNQIRIDLSAWYGEGAGLGGIELFQNSIWAYAVDNFNSPNCDGVANTNASATSTGPWRTTPSGDSYSQYLTANLPSGTEGGAGSDTSIIFTPKIDQSGNYSINMWTPGCLADGTCATRGQVTVTSNMGSTTGTSSAPYTTTIYQTNDYLKFDQIYYGYVEAGTDGFRPSVTLTPSPGQSGPLTIVAQSLGLNLTAAFGGSTSGRSKNGSTTYESGGRVNGLYEYNPDLVDQSTNFTTSAVDAAGAGMNNGAEILAMTVAESVLYAAGSFETKSFQNIMYLGQGDAADLGNGGLNDVVQTIFANDGQLYAGGNFTNTQDNSSTGLNNVASYSISDKTWSALGAGVNGIVYDIIPLQVNISGSQVQAIAVSGFFDQTNAFSNNDASAVDNTALWIPSERNWLSNMNTPTISLNGRLNAFATVPKSSPIFAGTIDSQTLGSRNAAGLSSSNGLNVQQLQLNIQAATETSSNSNTKRDVPQSVSNGAYTGYFFDESGLNLTIVGGHFSAMASNGSMISNLAILNGTTKSDTITGLAYNASTDAAVYALATEDTMLYVGGSFDDGILFYDLAAADLASNQPPGLIGNGATAHAIALQPKSNNLYVGGSFTLAGGLGCPGLCVYDTKLQQWNPPSAELSGNNTINFLQWASNTRLIMAGQFTVGNNRTTMAEYNTKTDKFSSTTNANMLPGPITAFTAVDNSFTSAFVAGTATSNSSAYLSHYDGKSTWTGIGGFGASTKIDGLQILTLSTSRAKSNGLMGTESSLLVMGMLDLPNYGNVSAALFNGTGFTPMALSTMDDGSPGSIYGAFVQYPGNLLNKHSSHLALGFVVLIGLACALGVVFLLVVLGILVERIRRRREGYVPAPTGAVMYEKSGGGKVGDISPDRLFKGVGTGGGAGPRI